MNSQPSIRRIIGKRRTSDRNRRSCRFRALGFESLERRQLLATIVVDTRFDISDASDDFTSLREAIDKAEMNAGPDIIRFDSSLSFQTILIGVAGFEFDSEGVPSAIASPSNQLVIRSDLILDASDARLVRIGRESGDESSLESSRLNHRVFWIEEGDVEMKNVVIQRGQVIGDVYGGGIRNDGTLTLTNVIVGDNRQVDGFGGGGGIYNGPTGKLTLINTTVGAARLDAETLAEIGLDASEFPVDGDGQPLLIEGNVADGPGGGIFNEGMIGDPQQSDFVGISQQSAIALNRSFHSGGGIFNAGIIEIADSTIEENVAKDGDGGGIFSSTSIPRNGPSATAPGPVSVQITRSDLRGNQADNGGGIFVDDNTSLVITEAVVAENKLEIEVGDGGGINNQGNTTVDRTSIVNNYAGNSGGGVFSSGTLTITSSTVSTNGYESAQSSVVTFKGGGLFIDAGTAKLESVTVTHNASESGGGIFNQASLEIDNTIVAGNQAFPAPDGQNLGTITGTNNLVGDNTSGSNGSENFLPPTGNLINVDPLLGPLGDHGGTTPTHGLLPASPAIDASYTEIVAGVPPIDQRGEPRIIGSRVDIGAFESQPPPSMRVDSLGDEVNGYYGSGDFTLREAILWAKQIPGPDTIGFGEELVSALQSRTQQDPLQLVLTGGEFLIDDELTILGPGSDLLSISGEDQSRIFSIAAGASVEIIDVTLTDGLADDADGGAIRNAGDLALRRVVVTNSSAAEGGGIYNTGNLLLDSAEVRDNSVPASGGGIYNAGTLELVGSTVSGSISGSPGAGIFVASGSQLIADNSTISSNRSSSRGGGIYFTDSSIGTLTNVTISNNRAEQDGGGIWTSSADVSVTLNDSIIWGNFAVEAPNDIVGMVTADSQYNLVGVTTGTTFQGENQLGVTKALLGPLRSVAGSPRLHVLLPGSPAIDAADPDSQQRIDQRGLVRPIGSRVDTGAFEYVPPDLPNPIVVDTLSGVTDGIYETAGISLGDAVAFANASPAHDAIVFDEALFAPTDVSIDTSAIVDLVQALPVTVNVSSSSGLTEPEDAIDGELSTSWFTANGDAASQGASPFFEIVFPQPVTATGITLRSTRTATDADFLRGRFDLFNAAGTIVYSKTSKLPDPALSPNKRDFHLPVPDQHDVLRVRFTSLADEQASNGFAEMEVYGTSSVIGLGDQQIEISDDLTLTGPGANNC